MPFLSPNQQCQSTKGKLKQLELMFIILGTQYPDNPSLQTPHLSWIGAGATELAGVRAPLPEKKF